MVKERVLPNTGVLGSALNRGVVTEEMICELGLLTDEKLWLALWVAATIRKGVIGKDNTSYK